MFAEGGGDGAGAATGSEAGSEAGAFDGAAERAAKRDKGNPLANVVYGKQASEDSTVGPDLGDNAKASAKTKSQMFDELIKGEYKDEFSKRTQSIIDRRFKETKGLEEKLNSHNSILTRLADKYGVDSSDPDAIIKALDSDESFYEQAAMEQGLTVKQYMERQALLRENESLKRATQEAEDRQHREQVYAKWLSEGEELKSRYGIENFDLNVEAQNPDFANLLKSGVSVEAAYKAVHFDDMVGGAMAATAQEVRTKMANGIASRSSRPTENGISPQSTQVFKRDVHALTKADREEIERRSMRGENISF